MYHVIFYTTAGSGTGYCQMLNIPL